MNVHASHMTRRQARSSFLGVRLDQSDKEVFGKLVRDRHRRDHSIEFLSSKTYMSRAVHEALSSDMTTVRELTHAVPYPGARHLASLEELARERARRLFAVRHADVAPASASQARMAAVSAMLKPGDKAIKLRLAGETDPNGKYVPEWAGVTRCDLYLPDGSVDYDALSALCRAHAPQLLIVDAGSYPRILDFAALKSITEEIGALMMVDLTMLGALVSVGVYPSPIAFAHTVVVPTDGDLRGPEGGIVLCSGPVLAGRVAGALSAGIQDGVRAASIAAKAVALGEALQPDFKIYALTATANARALAAILAERGYDLVMGGTDTALVVVDLRRHGMTGLDAERALEQVGITCNRALVRGDQTSAEVGSGLRFGMAGATTRGLGPSDIERLGSLVADVLDGLRHGARGDGRTTAEIRRKVTELAADFPVGWG